MVKSSFSAYGQLEVEAYTALPVREGAATPAHLTD